MSTVVVVTPAAEPQVIVATAPGEPTQVVQAATPMPYSLVIPVVEGTQLAEHLSDPTPHAAYDDLPSMTLIFENGIV